jgi:hypothetical protein
MGCQYSIERIKNVVTSHLGSRPHVLMQQKVEMRITASVAVVALLSVTTVSTVADEFEWGPLSTKPRDNQNTTWEAHCTDSSAHVVSGQCTIIAGSGTLQNVGVNDQRNTWTCVWGQTVKAIARALREMTW